MRANVSVRGFKMLRPISKKSRCSVSIKTRKGLPFFVYRHRNRKAFVVGALLFGALLLVMTRFIWVIEISGNEKVETAHILSTLEESGLKAGVLSSNINIAYIQSDVMIKHDDISWIGINLKGTTARIEIKEREPKPEIFPKDEPCSIVAVRDGVIESIDALNGHRLVTAGDVVTEGQLLISGALDSKIGDGVRYVHADGEVVARTWHEINVEIPRFEEIRTRTGKSKSKHMLKLFNFYVKFFLNDRISYENYDRISYVKNISFGKDIILPFSFHYDNYYEVDIAQQELERKIAVEMAAEKAYEQVRGLNVVSDERDIGQTTMKVTYECLENIALKKAVLREDAKDDGENTGG